MPKIIILDDFGHGVFALQKLHAKAFETPPSVAGRSGGCCMKDFVEQRIIAAVRGLLTGRVNEIFMDEEFATPVIEFGDYSGGDTVVVPVIALASCEKSEKERIIRLAAYSLTITLLLPETFEAETQCYAITAAVCTALKENPTLGGVADRAVVTGEKYVPPKVRNCGEGWGVVISLRVTVEN